MSQENVELGYRTNRAFNRRDIDEFLALCDPDVEFFAGITALEGGGPYRGRDGVRNWYEKVLEVSPDFSVEIEEVRDLGEMTFSRVLLRGHGIGSNVPIEQKAWSIVQWREKRVIRSQVFRSEAAALEAAGISE